MTRPALKTPVILINLSSSSSDDISGPLSTLLQRYGYAEPVILVGQSDDMETMLADMKAVQGDVLISFGGDGTSAAVAALAREQGTPFLPLPGGTMNMLCLGLYGSDVWDECLIRALAVAAPRPLTVGQVEDAHGQSGTFLVGCMIGQPTRMNDAREELRAGRVMDAARDAIDTLTSSDSDTSVQIAFDAQPFQDRTTELINMVCPFMTADALDPDQLHLTLFETVTGGGALSLGLAALLGNLKQSEAVEQISAHTLRLRTDKPIEALLDGEKTVFRDAVTITLDRNYGQVMAPWPAMSFPTSQDGKG